MKYTTITILALFLLSCSKEEPSIPTTTNESLNELIETVPSGSLVPIGNTPVDTVFADISNRITPEIESSQTVLGRVSGLTSIEDTLYIADQQNASIWKITPNGGNVQTIGRSGRGPGEFELLMGIEHNKASVFTVEPVKIQQFNRDMAYENEISQVVYGEKLAASDPYLFIPLNPTSNEHLIQVRQSSHPFDEVARILQPIIPPGFQPAAYNNIEIAASHSGQLVAAYNGLPYLFVFDSDFNIEHILYFQFAEGEAPENPDPAPVNQSEATGVTSFISNLNILDNNNIYFTYSMNLFRVVQDGDNYQLDKTIHFTFADTQKREETPWGLQPTSLHVQEDGVFIGSIFEESIYHFRWDDI